MLLKLVPDQTNIPFMRWRMPAIVFAVVLNATPSRKSALCPR